MQPCFPLLFLIVVYFFVFLVHAGCPCFRAKFAAARASRALGPSKAPLNKEKGGYQQCPDCLEWFRTSANLTRDGCSCVRAQFAAIKQTIAKRSQKQKGGKDGAAVLRSERRKLDSSRSVLDKSRSKLMVTDSGASSAPSPSSSLGGRQFYVDTWSETPRSAEPTLQWDETETSMYSLQQETKALESLDAMERQVNKKKGKTADHEKPPRKQKKQNGEATKQAAAAAPKASKKLPQKAKAQAVKAPTEAERKQAMEKIKAIKPHFGLSLKKKAMEVDKVAEGTPAADAGMKVGMKLLAVNQLRMNSSKDFAAMARKSILGDKMLCLLEDEGKKVNLVLQVGGDGLTREQVIELRRVADLPIMPDEKVLLLASKPLQEQPSSSSSPKKSKKEKSSPKKKKKARKNSAK